MSGTVRTASRDHKCPVRMLAVEFAVLIYHLRLDPDTEFQPHLIDLGDQFTERAAQLFFIDLPVSQTSELTVSVAEPAIVHDEHLDPQISCLFGEFQQRLAGEVKVGSLLPCTCLCTGVCACSGEGSGRVLPALPKNNS